MTPWGIIIASMIVLAADYLVDRYLRSNHSRKLSDILSNSTNPWLRNPLRSSEVIKQKPT